MAQCQWMKITGKVSYDLLIKCKCIDSQMHSDVGWRFWKLRGRFRDLIGERG